MDIIFLICANIITLCLNLVHSSNAILIQIVYFIYSILYNWI